MGTNWWWWWWLILQARLVSERKVQIKYDPNQRLRREVGSLPTPPMLVKYLGLAKEN